MSEKRQRKWKPHVLETPMYFFLSFPLLQLRVSLSFFPSDFISVKKKTSLLHYVRTLVLLLSLNTLHVWLFLFFEFSTRWPFSDYLNLTAASF